MIEIYLMNTETKQRYDLPYVEGSIDLNRLMAQYDDSGIPGTVNAPKSWVRTTSGENSFTTYLTGSDAPSKVEELQTLLKPGAGKSKPPIVAVKLPFLKTIQAYITAIAPKYDLVALSDNDKFTAKVSVTVGFISAQDT